MELNLNELERRANAATPGKWTWKQVGSFNTPGCAVFWPDTSKGGVHYRRLDSGGGMLEADANFVAAANPAVVLELERRLREAEGHVTAHIDEAVEAEREACAKVCEQQIRLAGDGMTFYTAVGQCAAAIRTRSIQPAEAGGGK